MELENSASVVQQITQLSEKLGQAQRTPDSYFRDEFTKNILRLEALAKDENANWIAAPLIQTSFFRAHSTNTRAVYELYEEFIETRALLDALNGSDPLENPQLKRTFLYAQKEAASAKITSSSRVAFVGSGPFPETALALSSATGCTVTCIDHHPEAVVLSQALFDKHRLHKLTAICIDARLFDYSAFTHILVAVLARPKKEILNQIARTCDKKTCVICRSVEGLKTLIYEPLEDIPLESFSLIGSVRDEKTIIHSLIFESVEVNT